jgi:hypothetical protein
MNKTDHKKLDTKVPSSITVKGRKYDSQGSFTQKYSAYSHSAMLRRNGILARVVTLNFSKGKKYVVYASGSKYRMEW